MNVSTDPAHVIAARRLAENGGGTVACVPMEDGGVLVNFNPHYGLTERAIVQVALATAKDAHDYAEANK